ncbi:MAG: bifunctional DNA-formamidopyrimidine glycosylase/DNA-(apurinic or apyrimidinic site) lyase [Rhizobiaceae bacterium]
MPELPEVETVRRGLAPVMEQARIEQLQLNRPNLRFPFPDDFAAQVEGQKIVSLGRRAKYLLVDLERGDVIIMHLGMSGSFRTIDGNSPGAFHHARSKSQAHDHVIFHLTLPDGSKAQVIYNDPRRFGFMLMTSRELLDQHQMIRDLGVEPVGNELSSELVASRFTGKNAPLKAALLDQSIIAGLGNIYVCEALWRSGLSPKRKARTLVLKSGKPTSRANLLVDNVRQVIQDAIAAGGSSLRDHAQTDGSLGYFQHSFAVYDQEGNPCQKPDCDGTIARIVQSGRSTFYCPGCQG